jgi:hypothetical protein
MNTERLAANVPVAYCACNSYEKWTGFDGCPVCAPIRQQKYLCMFAAGAGACAGAGADQDPSAIGLLWSAVLTKSWAGCRCPQLGFAP